MSNRETVTRAFEDWAAGTGHVSAIFADTMTWEIVGESAAAGRYGSKQAFVDDVLAPFGRRFPADAPFKPVTIRGIHADGDTVVVIWDGEGTTVAGTVYRNTYAWVLTLADGLVVDGLALFDSIAFDRLWKEVAPISDA